MKKLTAGLLLCLSMLQMARSDEATEYVCNGGKTAQGNSMPNPPAEQIENNLPQMQTQLNALGFVQAAHQCGLDTSGHIELLFRATESLGCLPGSGMYQIAAETAADVEAASYKARILFKNARNRNPSVVDLVCSEIAELDPNSLDPTSQDHANELSQVVADAEINLIKAWHDK